MDMLFHYLRQKIKIVYLQKLASALNGYAAIADTVAETKNIKLESSIGSSGKISSTIWRVMMYSIVILGLFAYTYAILKKKVINEKKLLGLYFL